MTRDRLPHLGIALVSPVVLRSPTTRIATHNVGCWGAATGSCTQEVGSGGNHWVLHTGHNTPWESGDQLNCLTFVHGLSFHYGVNSRWAGMVSFFKAVILDQIFPETACEAHLGWFWGAVPL